MFKKIIFRILCKGYRYHEIVYIGWKEVRLAHSYAFVSNLFLFCVLWPVNMKTVAKQ